MIGTQFYHGLLQKHVVLFGTLFNNMQITRNGPDGKSQDLKVPLTYGPSEPWLSRVEEDPELNRPYSVLLPRMTYEMTGFNYAIGRKLPSTQTFNVAIPQSQSTKLATQKTYMPVPYDINFRLSIMSKTVEDGAKILEQILPYFTPDWTVTAELMEDVPGYKQDIPIVLEGINHRDEYDESYEKRRVIIWELDFKLKAYFFGPVSKSKIIKIATINFYTGGLTDTTIDEQVTVRPGLTANGEPTSDAALSVPLSQIEEGDNYGYIVTIETNIND